MRLVIGDAFLVVDAAVQGEVEAEGQETHGVFLRSRWGMRRSRSGCKGTSSIGKVLNLCRLTFTSGPRLAEGRQVERRVRAHALDHRPRVQP